MEPTIAYSPHPAAPTHRIALTEKLLLRAPTGSRVSLKLHGRGATYTLDAFGVWHPDGGAALTARVLFRLVRDHGKDSTLWCAL